MCIYMYITDMEDVYVYIYIDICGSKRYRCFTSKIAG